MTRPIRFGAGIVAVVLSSAVAYQASVSRAEWSPVSDAEASRLVGGQTFSKCDDWGPTNCPTPKQKCVAIGCYSVVNKGAVKNRKIERFDNAAPCGTADKPNDPQNCPDTEFFPSSCGN
jgi:hypothetical protein